MNYKITYEYEGMKHETMYSDYESKSHVEVEFKEDFKKECKILKIEELKY